MDYGSLSSKHVHSVDLWRGEYEERGQTMAFEHAENQNWYYLQGPRTDEVTMIKIWDSKDEVPAKCTCNSQPRIFNDKERT